MVKVGGLNWLRVIGGYLGLGVGMVFNDRGGISIL